MNQELILIVNGDLREQTGSPVKSFYEQPSSIQAEERLNVWASVARARAEGIMTCPTMDAILGRAVPTLPAYLDPRTQTWVSDEILTKSTTSRLDSAVELTYLAMEVLFDMQGINYLKPVLLRLYPLTGMYEAPGKIWNGKGVTKVAADYMRRTAIKAVTDLWR